jgi:hypothetical protein
VGFNLVAQLPGFSDHHFTDIFVTSHLLFGGWGVREPSLDLRFRNLMSGISPKTNVWFPYYFAPYCETLDVLQGFKRLYYLQEKPFCPEVGGSTFPLSLWDYLGDGKSGLASVGIPWLLHCQPSSVNFRGVELSYATKLPSEENYPSTPHSRLV